MNEPQATSTTVLLRVVHDYQQTIDSLSRQLAAANARIADLTEAGEPACPPAPAIDQSDQPSD